MNQKISLITYGCKMNQAETQKIGEELLRAGYDIVFEEKQGKSDYYLINSCTVTSEAERKIRQFIRKIKRMDINKKIITVGCYSQVDSFALHNAGSDLVLGNLEKKYILDYIEKNGIFVNKAYWLNSKEKIYTSQKIISDKTRAFLPIQEGCNNACSFCKVIFARGTVLRSIKTFKVIELIQSYVENGYKEIVLTGINLGLFGKDHGESLEYLMSQLDKTFNSINIRIRLTSLYPDNLTDKVSEMLAYSNVFEKHIHLSLQHLSDKILKDMGRKYDKNIIISSINKLRDKNNFLSLSADLIVGFPGESDSDFEEIMDFLKHYDFLKIHVFRYSKRPGTKASTFKDQISGNLKKDRLNKIIKISDKSKSSYIDKMIDKNALVISEKTENGFTYGYDQYYIYHKINGVYDVNNILNVKIKNVEDEGVISDVF